MRPIAGRSDEQTGVLLQTQRCGSTLAIPIVRGGFAALSMTEMYNVLR
jgi:hypothetical protein